MLMVVDEWYNLVVGQVLSIGLPARSSRRRDQQQDRRQYTHALSSGFAEWSVGRRFTSAAPRKALGSPMKAIAKK
jgi:hypothetical protein